ncbi:MAG: bifunctional DNA primase/polymerase [Actinomycetota bacterium]
MTARATRMVLDDPDYRAQLLRSALRYAKRGWHVFPLRPGDKRPATPNHPAHLCDHSDPRCTDGHTGWEQRATTNPDRITRAWTRRPYGIGIATGPSGLLVVDLDTATAGGPSGTETWHHLTRPHPTVVTRTVATPSGGRHLYYQRPNGLVLANTASTLGPRIDTRANGGYIVAPPTNLPTGRYWTICATPAAEAPDWLLDALTHQPTPPTRTRRPTGPRTAPGFEQSERVRRYIDAALDNSAAQLQSVNAIGTRNRTLFEVARSLGQLVGAGALAETTAERVLWANTTHFLTLGRCTQSELAATIASGLRSGRRMPRQLPTDLTDPAPARPALSSSGQR